MTEMFNDRMLNEKNRLARELLNERIKSHILCLILRSYTYLHTI